MEQLIEFTNNNPLLVAGTVLMGLAVIFYELRKQAGGVTALSSAQAVQLINQGARIVDIRDEKKFNSGHIIDAINIPATEIGGDDSTRLKKAKSVLLVCDNGSESGKCVVTLKKSGIENAFSLRGGLANWQQDNLPVITSGNGKSDPKKLDKKKPDAQ
jgi:rhodanese-related sulfurtransferase